jgi:hypothetical protein
MDRTASRMDDSDRAIDAQARSIPDLPGQDHAIVLRNLHEALRPRTYLEIGTSQGNSLRLVDCASVAVDPRFQLSADVIGTKPQCAFYQMTSDRYFEHHDPKLVLGGPIDLAFLDGMHHCEVLLRDFINTERHCRKNSVVILHDCVPVETSLTERSRTGETIETVEPHRHNWWLGDVWRTLLALKRHRRDLSITALDAPPSGLVCITGLDPQSTVLDDAYAAIVVDMLSWSLDEIGLAQFLRMIDLESTARVDTPEKIRRRFPQ